MVTSSRGSIVTSKGWLMFRCGLIGRRWVLAFAIVTSSFLASEELSKMSVQAQR